MKNGKLNWWEHSYIKYGIKPPKFPFCHKTFIAPYLNKPECCPTCKQMNKLNKKIK